ncbi:MAG TPA: retropepsin-like aspartic protease [Polyangiaceae bacterium]|jgi:predicted aspartyl protease
MGNSDPFTTPGATVSRRCPYSTEYDPPAPILPVCFGDPAGSDGGVAASALVDSGADISVIPVAVAEALRLPRVDLTSVTGVGGTVRAPIVAARLDIARRSLVVRAVALADEAILGRDVINRFTLTLDGPGRALEMIAAPVKRAGSRRAKH